MKKHKLYVEVEPGDVRSLIIVSLITVLITSTVYLYFSCENAEVKGVTCALISTQK